MGGSSSSSQQSSQSTSEARQALYTPSPASITDSINQLLGIYQQSTAQLAPFNQTAFDAVNDMRYWQGMAGIDPALSQQASLQGYMDTLKAPGRADQLVTMDTVTIGGMGGYRDAYSEGRTIQDRGTRTFNVSGNGQEVAFNNQKLLMNSLNDVNTNLTLLSTEQDPTKRQSLYDSIMSGFSNFDTTAADILKTYNAPPAAAIKGSGTQVYDPTGNVGMVSTNPSATTGPRTYGSGGSYVDANGVEHKLPDNWWNLPDYDPSQTTSTPGNSEDFLKQVSDIDALKAKVMAQFKKEGNPAPTPDQVLKRLQSTPGYTTQLNQGLQAIQNTQVAKGLFNSGRAGQELTRYGQDYAQNALTNQFNRSAQLAGMTLPSVAQQSQNTVAQAAPIMASTQLAGSGWSMSPWTQKAQSSSQGTSESKTDGGGLGQILGSVMGGLF